ncbi:MAG: hypothetical protein ALECFALPRED_002451 [Alectoria fallacina]|uniref:Kinesin light chain n=1 Tax=Alectoria fallacina TaxID=1903189 RepID=A0A8H3I6E9_9LECA|nr:MAG: hypothetical protein ALECFALPRED_002451 [Alectoria fallacina]
MANLAVLDQKQGPWKETEAVGIEVLEQKQRILGQSYPDTLTSMNNLALTYSDQTRWKEAEDLQEKLLKLSQLGQDHPLTLNFMGNIAATYTNQQRWKEAEDHFRENPREKKKGDTRPRAPGHIDNHGQPSRDSTTISMDGRKRQRFYTCKSWRFRQKTLGTEHPDTLTCARNVAESLRKQGRFEEAERIHRQTLSSWENLHGKEHHNTLSSKEILAKDTTRSGQIRRGRTAASTSVRDEGIGAGRGASIYAVHYGLSTASPAPTRQVRRVRFNSSTSC